MDFAVLLRWARSTFVNFLTASALGAIVTVSAARSEMIEVRLAPDQTIRQLSEQYLGDPDLWPEILKASNLSSVADLAPGLALRVPVDLIAAADRALARSLEQIRQANLAGAQLFAPDEIGRAIGLYDSALGRRIDRAWAEVRDLALSSYAEASGALAIAEKRRDEAAEALLSDRQGEVEGQKPRDLAWNNLQIRAVLVEEEKVRTLSDSTAQLTFRDASRLRLNANSNAVIQQMRYDPLTKQEEAKVSLVEGDFYALLAGESDRKSFAVDIPEAQARIESGDFWVKSDDSGAKFTNYDDRPVAIATSTEKVVLGRNEGVVLSNAGVATAKQGVLDAPRLHSPANDGIVYNNSFELAWTAQAGAAGYWLEIGADQTFDTMVVSKFGLTEPSFLAENLPPGEYYWRIASLDGFGLPGQRSAAWRFSVAIDGQAPFLRIDAPREGMIERDSAVEIEGETEPGTTLIVNGHPVAVTAAGRFTTGMTASEGDNRIEVAVSDPAGNTTRLTRAFSYMQDRADAVILDAAIPRDADGRILTGSETASLSGHTKPSSRIDIMGSDNVLRASTQSDAAGAFALNVGLTADRETLSIAVTAPSGFQAAQTVEIAIDRTRPVIELSEELPRLTASGTLFIKGRVSKPGAKLALGGRNVPLKDGVFDEIVNLAAGDNPIELVATDSVGHVDVARFTVALDTEPPRLMETKLAPSSGDGGSFVIVDVAASDASGLAATARSIVEYGDETADGILEFNRATQAYQGMIAVPSSGLKIAAIRSIELTDAAGNRKSYRVD